MARRPAGHAGAVNRIGAVILAAGAGLRMGRRAKSLLLIDGQPLILRLIGALQTAGIADIVVVLGHHAHLIQAALAGQAVELVHNPRPDDGPTGSQRLGLQQLNNRVDAVLMALADQPWVDSHDILALMQAYANRPAGTELVFPWVHQQPGNPVLLSQSVGMAILQAGPSVGPKQWRQSHAAQVHRWPTPNPHFTTDVDTPADVALLAQTHLQVVAWPDDIHSNG